MKTNIAVCGRTNVGKTAFITTVRNQYSGKILDESNTTVEIVDYPHDVLSIVLSDFPGFEKMGAVEALANLKKDEEFAKLEKENPILANKLINALLGDEFSKRDYDLIQELKNRDLIFVVCSIESYPEATHTAEIEMIKQVNSNIIAIISKTGIYEKRERVNGWIKLFEKLKIKYYIEFDAHFDNKSKIVDLMKLSLNFLTNHTKIENLSESIFKFNAIIVAQNEKIRNSFIEFIMSIVSLELKSESKNEVNRKIENFKTKIASEFKNYTDTVVSSLNIDIQEFNELIKTAKINITEVRTPYEVLEAVIPGVARGVSVILLGVIMAGNPILGLAGAVYLGWNSDKVDKEVNKLLPTKSYQIIRLTSVEVNEFAKIGILIYWLASKFGYARRYRDNEIVNLVITQKDIQEFHSRLINISDIKQFNRENLRNWFDNAINEIEQKSK